MSLTKTFVDQNQLLLSLRTALKDELYDKSPLRNKFQVRPVDGGELAQARVPRGAHYVSEEGIKVLSIKNAKYIWVPFFELSNNIVLPNDYLKIEKKKLISLLVKKVKILERETELYNDIKKYKGKGVFYIRTDLQILPFSVENTNKTGFAIFETVGLAKINGITGTVGIIV